MVRHGGSSAGSYPADPTSPIPSHCASIVVTSTLKHNIVTLMATHWSLDYLFCLTCFVVSYPSPKLTLQYRPKGKGKGSCLEPRLHDNACSTDFTFPLARWAPMQPASIDPTLDLFIRYPLWLGGPRQCRIQSLPATFAHGQHCESNSRPFDLESTALSTGPNAPTWPKWLLPNCAVILVGR